jgi:hypothetical protein
MPSPRILPLALVLFALGCPAKPLEADEAESTGSETGSATDTTSDTGEICEDRVPGEFFSYALAIDGETIAEEDMDLDRECTVFDDDGDPTLTLACGDFGFQLTLDGAPGEALLDVVDANVHLRFVQTWSFNYADRWLRLDFLGEDLSVYVIDAAPLQPASGWAVPWGLAVGQSCLVEPSIDQYAESLTLAREGQMLELWQGESGLLGAGVEVWVDRSLRDGPEAPAGDGPPSWKELAIVSHQPPP